MPEQFSTSKKRSMTSVYMAAAIASAWGHEVRIIEHNLDKLAVPYPGLVGVHDPGDLEITKLDRDGSSKSHIVDAKQALAWKERKFPFQKIFVTTKEQYHNDRAYWVFSADLSRVAFIKPKSVPEDRLIFEETVNRRSGPQISVGVPVKFAVFKDVIALLAKGHKANFNEEVTNGS